jgi:hypothetical protein
MKIQPALALSTVPADNATPLPLFVMARFRRLMFVQGWSVDLARLCVDPAYMYECLGRAHQCGEEQLHRVALVLFAGYCAPVVTALAH